MLAIVLLDHGSRRPEANAQLDELRERVAARRPGALVVAAHLEVAKPDLAQAVAECVAKGASRVVVHPFFLSPGRHTMQDLPEQIDAARGRHPGIAIAASESLGLSDELVEIVLARIDAAAHDTA
jgi:sirohydrochlorin ferrochelatase